MGRIKLLNTDIELTLPPKVPAPKKPSITPDQIKANIKKLIERYQVIGGKIETYFLEQILGREILEQILKSLDQQTTDNKSSEKSEGRNSEHLTTIIWPG